MPRPYDALVDVDAFVTAHSGEWARLEQLLRRRRLGADEADELVSLYQRVSTHLSVVRSSAPDPSLVARLSTLVNRARQAVAGSREPVWRDVARFFVVEFPAGLYRAGRLTIVIAASFLLIAGASGAWVANDPQVQASLASDAEIRLLCEVQFESYYSENPAASFHFIQAEYDKSTTPKRRGSRESRISEGAVFLKEPCV